LALSLSNGIAQATDTQVVGSSLLVWHICRCQLTALPHRNMALLPAHKQQNCSAVTGSPGGSTTPNHGNGKVRLRKTALQLAVDGSLPSWFKLNITQPVTTTIYLSSNNRHAAAVVNACACHTPAQLLRQCTPRTPASAYHHHTAAPPAAQLPVGATLSVHACSRNLWWATSCCTASRCAAMLRCC
jgi:hypothetical protein